MQRRVLTVVKPMLLKDYKAAYATFSESYQKSKKAIDDYELNGMKEFE